MKLIMAVVNGDDSSKVIRALVKKGFSATKLATTGGFLMAKNTTFLIGVEDEKVDEVIEIISTNSKKRKQPMPLNTNYGVGVMPVEVTVGGATIFVTDVERFEKV